MEVSIITKKEKEKYDIFLTIRPVYPWVRKSKKDMPVIKSLELSYDELKNSKFTNFSNLSSIKNKSQTIITMFTIDSYLERLWRDPLKYLEKLKGFKAVATPDFSIYKQMTQPTVAHNTYKNRWIGSFLMNNGINIIPTVSWGGPETFDICFDAIAKGSTVIISTFGVKNNLDAFKSGYLEMVKRIQPKSIIVVGRLYDFMNEQIINLVMKDTFNPKSKNKHISLLNYDNQYNQIIGESKHNGR